jgi:hypothetical protein
MRKCFKSGDTGAPSYSTPIIKDFFVEKCCTQSMVKNIDQVRALFTRRYVQSVKAGTIRPITFYKCDAACTYRVQPKYLLQTKSLEARLEIRGRDISNQ